MFLAGPVHTFRFTAEDNVIANQAAAATLSLLHQPPSGGSHLKITISGGTANTGTVTVTGTLSGVAKTDTLTWTAARYKITTNQYDTISSITTSGLADEATKPTIKVESSDVTGVPKYWTSTSVQYGTLIRYLVRNDAEINLINAGQTVKDIFKCKIDGDPSLYMNQEFTIDSQNDVYVISTFPKRHFQLSTDYVDYVQFYAVAKYT